MHAWHRWGERRSASDLRARTRAREHRRVCTTHGRPPRVSRAARCRSRRYNATHMHALAVRANKRARTSRRPLPRQWSSSLNIHSGVVGLAGLRRRLPRSKATPSGAAPVRLFRCERAVLARPAHAPTCQMCADARKCRRATCGTDGRRAHAGVGARRARRSMCARCARGPRRTSLRRRRARAPRRSRSSSLRTLHVSLSRVVPPAGALAAPSTAQQQHHPRVTGACIGGCLGIAIC
jgi:hypothetical protein